MVESNNSTIRNNEEIYKELEITYGKPPRTTSEKNGFVRISLLCQI